MPKGYYVKPMSCDGRYWYDVKRDGRWIKTFKLESEAETFANGATTALKDRWIPVTESFPETLKPVLVCAKDVFGEKRTVLRAAWLHAAWVPKRTVGGYLNDSNEENYIYYWPEGWYEWDECDETHWRVDVPVTHWMPLPATPTLENKKEREQ